MLTDFSWRLFGGRSLMTLFSFICAIILLMGLICPPITLFFVVGLEKRCFVNTWTLYVHLGYVIMAEYLNFQPRCFQWNTLRLSHP